MYELVCGLYRSEYADRASARQLEFHAEVAGPGIGLQLRCVWKPAFFLIGGAPPAVASHSMPSQHVLHSQLMYAVRRNCASFGICLTVSKPF